MSESSNNTPATTNQALAVPDYLKAMQGQSNDADSMASASASIPRISMRGKKFRFMEGGEEILAVNDHIDVIIHGVEPGPGRFIKTFYKNGYTGADSKEPPTCASDDGIRPSAWVSERQHPTCDGCPKNVFGSAKSRQGKPSKACRDAKRLWVARKEEAHDPEATLYAIQATVMSLKNLSDFGRKMKELNAPIAATVTRITMDDDSEFPMIDFAPVGFLPQEQAIACIDRAKTRPWAMMQVGGGAQLPAPEPTMALPGQPAPATPAAAAAAQPAGPTTPAPGKVDDITSGW